MNTRSKAKKISPQLQRGAALSDKYNNINKTNKTHSVVAIIGQEGQQGPSVSLGPVRLPNEILKNLSGYGNSTKYSFENPKFSGETITFTTYLARLEHYLL